MKMRIMLTKMGSGMLTNLPLRQMQSQTQNLRSVDLEDVEDELSDEAQGTKPLTDGGLEVSAGPLPSVLDAPVIWVKDLEVVWVLEDDLNMGGEERDTFGTGLT